MHSALFALVPHGTRDVDGWLQGHLLRFNDNLDGPERFELMSDEELGQMRAHYGVDDLEALASRMKDWRRCPGEVRDGRLGYVTTSNPLARMDSCAVGGAFDGRITGCGLPPRAPLLVRVIDAFAGGRVLRERDARVARNRLAIRDCTPDRLREASALVTPDGRWLDRGDVERGLAEDEGERRWVEEARALLAEHPGCDVVVVDYHH